MLGETTSSGGYGVYGYSNSAGGAGGTGVYGQAFSPSGITYGVYGFARSSTGFGGYFYNNTAGVALVAESETASGDVFQVYGADNTDVEFRVEGDGDVYADGTFNNGGADFAELLPAVDGLQPGDLLVIGPDGKLILSTQPYQSSVAGVYSTQPGFLGGAADSVDQSGKVPLAVVGVVPVKVSAESGSIQPGDLLTTSSTPGHAMKASPITVDGFTFYPSGVVIGKALEGLEAGTGVILVLVMLQ